LIAIEEELKSMRPEVSLLKSCCQGCLLPAGANLVLSAADGRGRLQPYRRSKGAVPVAEIVGCILTFGPQSRRIPGAAAAAGSGGVIRAADCYNRALVRVQGRRQQAAGAHECVREIGSKPTFQSVCGSIDLVLSGQTGGRPPCSSEVTERLEWFWLGNAIFSHGASCLTIAGRFRTLNPTTCQEQGISFSLNSQS
jgi:hypothetical protein